MRLFKYIRKHWVLSALLVIVLALIVWFFFLKKPADKKYEYVAVKRGDVVQEVSVTGKVEPAKSVSLSFEKSGRIVISNADVGSHVWVGQTLVELDHAEISAQLAQANANIKVQQAKLDKLLRGSRPEEIVVEETKVANAKLNVVDAERNLKDKIYDAYTKSDDAIRNKADQLFNNPRSSSLSLKVSFADYATEDYLKLQRPAIESLLIKWSALIDVSISLNNIDDRARNTQNDLQTIKEFLDKAAFGVNGLTVGGSVSQTTIDSYKADISTARTNINTAIVNLTAAIEKYQTAKSTLNLAERELSVIKAGSDKEDILAGEAALEEAEASAKIYEAQLEKYILRSPMNGVITKYDAKVGEVASSNKEIISIISDNQFQIKMNIPEADISKIRIGNIARVTLDAYGDDEKFEANIVTIDPGETVVEGIATYEATLQFKKNDARIRSGMTANIDIETARKNNVLSVPQRTIVSRDGVKYVNIFIGQNITKEIMVSTGLLGSEGNVEITLGLSEGDKAILFIE
ncbi:MAG: efflux RND transporter periplasmic adaptor subunit [Patescibacteria group bacterium]